MNKITFKKHPKNTGLFSIGHPDPNVDIKLDGKVIGVIYAPTWQTKDNKWSVSFQVYKEDIMEDGNPNCKWKWIDFSKRFETENEAREYTKENIGAILSKYIIYYMED